MTLNFGDLIDTFRNTTQAVNQEFVGKSQIEDKCLPQDLKLENFTSIMWFQVTPFCRPMFKFAQ